jgi:sterol desaturase/sphingolipid hydroxylase (fatty acid hydroxylase superfamily)
VEKYLQLIQNAYSGYWSFVVTQMLYPTWHNYLYWVIGSSMVVYTLELLFPWRKDQPSIREHFFVDMFYILWNYFLFSLVIYHALSLVFVTLFSDFLGLLGITNTVALYVGNLPRWGQLVLIFVLRDFMQWAIHRLLHHVDWMWEFHKVHHSTEEMGFAALMRYHFMEHLFYRTLEYLPLAMLGFGIGDFFVVHMFTFVTGQLGHANLYINLGPLRYILNGPQMHLWHHAREFPSEHPRGFNFGITLSVWDYLFGTSYHPFDDPNLPVGLPDTEKLPRGFIAQNVAPFQRVWGKVRRSLSA